MNNDPFSPQPQAAPVDPADQTLNIPYLRERFDRLEACARLAPPGAYERARVVFDLIGTTTGVLRAGCRNNQIETISQDGYRDIAAMIYGHLLLANPDAVDLVIAESFGEAASGPNGDLVIAQAKSDPIARTHRTRTE